MEHVNTWMDFLQIQVVVTQLLKCQRAQTSVFLNLYTNIACSELKGALRVFYTSGSDFLTIKLAVMAKKRHL